MTLRIFVFFAIILGLWAEEKKETVPLPEESARQRAIRLRAREIELRKELEKTQREIKKTLSPAEKQATKEVESAEKKKSRQERAEAQARARAELSFGCVSWIDPKAVDPSSGRVNAKYTVTNTSQVAVDIRDDHLGKVVVRGLCPGETMTLVKNFPSHNDGNSIYVSYSATGNLGGRVGISRSPTTSLSSLDISSQATRIVTWEIRLQPY